MRMLRSKNLKTDRALFTADTIKIAERGVLVTMCGYVNVFLGHPSFIFTIINFRNHVMECAPNDSLVLVTPSGSRARRQVRAHDRTTSTAIITYTPVRE